MVNTKDFKRAWPVIVGLITLIGLFSTFYAIDSYIDRKIEARTSDPIFIHKIASHVRPSLIFDSNGSILAEMGAMQYLNGLTVKLDSNKNGQGIVVVEPKELLNYPPLITAMDGIFILPKVKRGPGYAWVYEIDSVVYIYSRLDISDRPFKFRLEIIK